MSKVGKFVKDSFVNFAARLGWGADNMASQASYQFDFITRNRTQLEAMYRSSWIIGQIVDVKAEDMTRAGVTIHSDMPPDEMELLEAAQRDLCIWQRLCATEKWARLFGGAVAVMLIDGQDVSTELRLDTIQRGQFKGLLVLDRWLVQPTMTDLITEFGPDLGLPRYYEVVSDAQALPAMKIHHSRVLRLDGIELPYYQRIAENGWSESVVERVFDRLVAFDSTTSGAAQLVYRAHLRTYKVPGLRDLISTGGKAFEALLQQIEMIRMYQSNEGMTLMDAEDSFESHQYTFAGLSDVLLQFGQQLSGATGIPLVRLFGQSPAGLNSTGESDLRTYYDGIKKDQENKLLRPLTILFDVLCRSVLGKPAPNGFGFTFNSLWQLTDEQKANIAKQHTDTVVSAYEATLISAETALKELRQLSHVTGVFTNITDEEIEMAKNAPPPGESALIGHNGGPPLDEPKPGEESDEPEVAGQAAKGEQGAGQLAVKEQPSA